VKGILCAPVCGDGQLKPEEACDDGNLNDGDGCSAACRVENHFVCNGTTPVGASECYLLSLDLALSRTLKDTTQNSFTLYFSPQPAGLSALYASIDWSSMVSLSPNSVLADATVRGATYNPSSSMVEVRVNYH
jgi:cysteine-rich repeat protein